MLDSATKPKDEAKSSSKSSSADTPKPKLAQKYIAQRLLTKTHQNPPLVTTYRAYFDTKIHQIKPLLTRLNYFQQLFHSYSLLRPKTPKRYFNILMLNVIANRNETKGGDLLMELLKLEEVMAELKISRTTLWRLRQSGVIKECRLGGLIWITRADLNRFIRNEVLAGRSL